MTRYETEQDANADGYTLEHQPDHHRFVVVKGEEVLGTAQYALFGSDDLAAIDFNSTVLDPALRGTGLANLLAERALTDDIVKGRKVQASCSFIEGFLERNPHLRSD